MTMLGAVQWSATEELYVFDQPRRPPGDRFALHVAWETPARPLFQPIEASVRIVGLAYLMVFAAAYQELVFLVASQPHQTA